MTTMKRTRPARSAWRARSALLALGTAATMAGMVPGTARAGWNDPPDTPRTKELKAILARTIVPNGVGDMALSPDGKHLAVLTWTAAPMTGSESREGEWPYIRSVLLMDTATMAVKKMLMPERREHVIGVFQGTSFHWISNDRLAVNTNFGQCLVMDLDGETVRTLGTHLLQVIHPPGDGADPLAIVGAPELFDRDALHRVNLRTGASEKVPTDLPGDVVDTVYDPKGRLRAAVTRETRWFVEGAKISTWYRHDEKAPWQLLQQVGGIDERWLPLAVPSDADTLLVASRQGRDTWALFNYDAVARKTTDLVAGSPTEDLVRVEEDADAEVQRVVTNGLKPTTWWFEPDWQRIQRAVDAAIPGAVNTLSGDPKGAVLIASHADREPGRWLLLDTTRMKMKTVGHAMLNFDTAPLQPMDTLTYAAPDGLKIPAYLTLPAGPKRPRPMVVYLHGGPIARDHWGYDQDAQVLAQAGYAVFQPQFRGSAGFGAAFEAAGYRQWGLAMQDDVTAGVKAMIDQGVADPQRICIYGASYGGYAALWGLARTPDLYRCGVSLAGVSDIGEMFTDWSDINADKVGPEAMRFFVGDVATMKTQFDAVSPQKHADQIKVPVLLAHGKDDKRVPIGHSRRMASALEAAHVPVETHWYDGEAHGLAYQADERDFQLALLAFLDRHIGPASSMAAKWEAPVPPGAAGPALAASASAPAPH